MLLPKRIFFLLFSILFLCSSASANFDSAFKLYEKGKYAEAFYAFKNLAYIGDKSSQFNLGVMYFRGEHVQSDPVEAYAWIVVAAEGGDESFLKTKKIIFGKFNEKEQVAAAGKAKSTGMYWARNGVGKGNRRGCAICVSTPGVFPSA